MILSSVNFVKTSSRQPKSHFDFSDFIIGKIKEEQEFNDRCNKCGSPSEHVSCDLSYQSKSLMFLVLLCLLKGYNDEILFTRCYKVLLSSFQNSVYIYILYIYEIFIIPCGIKTDIEISSI